MNLKKIVLLGLLGAACVGAQAPAPQKEKVAVSQQPGDMELGLFTGAVIPPNGGSASAGGGANFAYAVNTYIYPYFEFSALPGALNSSVTAANTKFVTSGNLADFHGGLHLRIPVNPRFVPYGVFAVGGFRSFSGTIDQFNTTTGNKVISTPIPSSGSFLFNYGGGIRYYITDKIGVRFETTAYGPTGKFGGTPVRVMGGVFFQFKKK